MFFIDSVVLISAKRERDKWHFKGFPIVQKIASGSCGKGYLVDFVLLETINFLHRKDGPKVAMRTMTELLETEYLELIISDEIAILSGYSLMKQFPMLSLTDAVIAYYMKEFGVSLLYSFDSDFDSVPWINRQSTIK